MNRFRRHPAGVDGRTSLLFVSPVIPCEHGNGLAMRAAFVLRALVTRYQVTLLVIPRYLSPAGTAAPAAIRADCARVVIVPDGLEAGSVRDEAGHALHPRDFAIIHIFRLGTVPLAARWLDDAPVGVRRWLDLDDLEATTHRRIAALHRRRGEALLAELAEFRADRAEVAERDALVTFDRIFLAAAPEREHVPMAVRDRIEVLPNALPLAEPLPPAPLDAPFTMLFVGTLDYFPNRDAVSWFARDVLPLVQRETARPVRFDIVGDAPPALQAELAVLPNVRLAGRAPDLRARYATAHAVTAPLRAGGGTRIKVIEAFALGRPVVGTPIGFEGLAVTHGNEALVADTAEGLALALLSLLDNPRAAATMAARARSLMRARYSTGALAALVASWPD